MKRKQLAIILFTGISFYGNQTHTKSFLAPTANKGLAILSAVSHSHLKFPPSVFSALRIKFWAYGFRGSCGWCNSQKVSLCQGRYAPSCQIAAVFRRWWHSKGICLCIAVSGCVCVCVCVCVKEQEHKEVTQQEREGGISSKTDWLALLRIGGLPYQARRNNLSEKS